MKTKYGFKLKSAHQLYDKAYYDLEEFLRIAGENPEDSDESLLKLSYKAIDCVLAIWHFLDWIAKETGRPRSEVEKYLNEHSDNYFGVAGDLACGIKHFQRDRDYPPRIVHTSTAGPVTYDIFDLVARDNARLYVIMDGKAHTAELVMTESVAAIGSYLNDMEEGRV